MESLVSRRRFDGREVVGDAIPKVAELFWELETDVLRPAVPLIGVFSLDEFCGGGLRGELTVAANNYTPDQRYSSRTLNKRRTSFSSSVMSIKPKG